ncbi:hypothetical protein FZW96_14845 [Bacillus sp. BGMRC 2118]|nr:hypothetical protein FZW96_14845 [Bacillus sp. BGMRC 2118]
MAQYFIDFTLVSLLVIGLTAILGVLLNGIGERFFGRGKAGYETVHQSTHTQTGWNNVGGKKKK